MTATNTEEIAAEIQQKLIDKNQFADLETICFILYEHEIWRQERKSVVSEYAAPKAVINWEDK